jgi:hypothetical protein
MLDTYIKNRGITKTIIHDGKKNDINEIKWDADYDGDIANISLNVKDNGIKNHIDLKLTNDDLEKLLKSFLYLCINSVILSSLLL